MKSFLFKFFCFPWWLFRRLKQQKELNLDLQRRIFILEETVRNTLPDMERRLKAMDADWTIFRPDVLRRLQMVEDEIRATHPDLKRRILTVEENIRTRLLNQPAYREVSAKKLPADCSCKHILGKIISSPEKPRILVDVSQLLIVNGRSGIQRVVVRVLDAMLEDSRCLYVPVGLYTGKMHYVEYHQEEGAFYIGEPVTVRKKDTLLMLDSSWEFYDLFARIFKQIHDAEGNIYIMVYDLIPLLQEQFVAEGMISVFRTWIKAAVKIADGMLCISKTVAGQLNEYIQRKQLFHEAEPLKIGHFLLGADFTETAGQPIDPLVSEILAKAEGKKKFLSVSTIEPRKNYDFMLSVMERLWERGFDVVYFIVGKQGWKVDELISRIKNHPEFNKRLFWFNFLADKELQQVYRESDILLNLSHGEGFGLSLVEGAHYQCSIIASDIPVFREVITDDTTLFCDISSLDKTADAIADKLDHDSFVPSAAKYHRWSDALSSILQCMRNNTWDFEVMK